MDSMESSQSTNTFSTLVSSPQELTFSTSKNGNSCIPTTIPPEHSHRTLVVCFDGTGDQINSDNSNIVDFFRLLKKDNSSKQIVYYQPGIGNHMTPTDRRPRPYYKIPLFNNIRKLADEAIAWDLDRHIMRGYKFLMDYYDRENHGNDKICIFGFSRGAYTARCLAGMIHKIGLLPKSHGKEKKLRSAYKVYASEDNIGLTDLKAVSTVVDIHFLGVWDSVNSVGLIPHCLPDSTSNPAVRTFRHAISLDERRVKFKMNTWTWSHTDQKKAEEAHRNRKSGVKHHKQTPRVLENMSGSNQQPLTDVDEVWFAGCHSDIGGGSVKNGVKPCLARISLRWMIRECFKAETGIMFHTECMKEIGLDPASLYPIVLPRPPAIDIAFLDPPVFIADTPTPPNSTVTAADTDDTTSTTSEVPEIEEEADLYDSLAHIHDQLLLNWLWWILELIPWQFNFDGCDDTWQPSYIPNLGCGRKIEGQSSRGVRVHRSVKTRMDATYKDGKTRYQSKATLEEGNVIWVD